MTSLLSRLRTLYRRKSLMYNILIFVMACLMITFVFLELVYISVSRDMLIENVYESEVNILKSIDDVKTNLNQSIVSISNLLYANDEFTKLTLKSRLTTYQDLRLAEGIANQILLSNHNFKTIALYLPKSDRMITTDYGIYMDANQYFDDEILKFYANVDQSLFIRENRHLQSELSAQSGPSFLAYSIFIKLYTDTRNTQVCNAVLAINADYQRVYENLISTDQGIDKLFLVYYKEDLVYSNKTALDDASALALSDISQHSIRSFQMISGVQHMVVSYASGANLYVSMLPLGYVDRSIARMTELTLASCAAILALSIALAFLFSRRTIRPLEKAVLSLQSQSRLSFSEPQQNDMVKTISRIGNYTQQLHEKIYSSLPLMREEFLKSILHGPRKDTQQYTDIVTMLELCLDPQAVSLTVMEHYHKADGENALAEEMIMHQSMHTLVRGYLDSQGCRCEMYQWEPNATLLFVNAAQTPPQTYYELFDNLAQYLKEVADIAVSFIVCEDVESFDTLHRSFERCLEMRSYKRLYKKGFVLTCSANDIYQNVDLSDYPMQAEDSLINAILHTDLQEAVIQLDVLLTSISSSRSLLFLQNFINNFIIRLSEVAGHAGKDPNEILMIPELDKIFLKEHYMDEIQDLLCMIIEATIEALSSGAPYKSKAYRDKVVRFINENYHRDISLVDASEHLGTSKNYVNTIIRNNFDMTFVQLLTKIRIEIASELLKDGKLSINEIARMAGFGSARYFIQVFKKQKGYTPGQYR